MNIIKSALCLTLLQTGTSSGMVPKDKGKLDCLAEEACDIACFNKDTFNHISEDISLRTQLPLGVHSLDIQMSNGFTWNCFTTNSENYHPLTESSKRSTRQLLELNLKIGRGHGISRYNRNLYALSEVLLAEKKLNFFDDSVSKVFINIVHEVFNHKISKEFITNEWNKFKKQLPEKSGTIRIKGGALHLLDFEGVKLPETRLNFNNLLGFIIQTAFTKGEKAGH